MWQDSQFPEELVTLTEEILNRKLHFSCIASEKKEIDFTRQTTMLLLFLESINKGDIVKDIKRCRRKTSFILWQESTISYSSLI